MRTDVAIVTGIVIGFASAGAAWLALDQPRVRTTDARGERATPGTLPPADVASAPLLARAARPSIAPTSPTSHAVPVTPVYGPLVEAPPPIYRCRSGTRTVYSDAPCAGATVVDASGAVTGYDTRPSERLARLVAEGRSADADGPPTVARADTPPGPRSAECATLQRQIRDIDAAALQPATRETQDEWRRIRQDIRTGMARAHC